MLLVLRKHILREHTLQNDDRRSKFNFPPVDENKGFDIVDVLDEIASERNVSIAQISLAWLLQQPVVNSVILGEKREEQHI